MQMVDDIIFHLVDKKNISVKVAPIRASNRPNKEVSAAVAGRSHLNVNAQGVPTRQKRMDSVGDTGLKMLGAHVGSDEFIAPNVTPLVTLGGSSRTESGGAPPG